MSGYDKKHNTKFLCGKHIYTENLGSKVCFYKNENSGPGAQKYRSNEDGHASPVMKRRSLALQCHNCHFSSSRRAIYDSCPFWPTTYGQS